MSATPSPAGTLTMEEASRLRLAVLRVARVIRQRATSTVTPSQLTVLMTVERDGPLTLGEIAARERMQPPSASRIVAALEAQGLVVRHTDPTDRRVSLIDASPAGHRFAAEHREWGRSWIAGRVGELEPDDVERIRAAIPALERLLEHQS
jgi:DNA-binding MarR family transcriptional regulator